MAWSDAFSPRNRFGQTAAEENWSRAHFGDEINGSFGGRDPNETDWGAYGRVLEARGAQLGGARTAQPSAIGDDPASSFNTSQAGPRPWGQGGDSMTALYGDPAQEGLGGLSLDALLRASKAGRPIAGRG